MKPNRLDLDHLTPSQIVNELSRYVIGQDEAKKAVAIALRNRWRRQRVEDSIREEIVPYNIILIGPTGVGKTEIARRLAKLAGAPFIKVEATKFTEVGYVGRDVESIIRELMDIAVNMVRKEMIDENIKRAESLAEDKLLNAIVRRLKEEGKEVPPKDTLKQMLREGVFDTEYIEIDTKAPLSIPMAEIFIPGMGAMEPPDELMKTLGQLLPPVRKRKKMRVPEAFRVIVQEEADKLLDKERMIEEAKRRVEETGIVFLDEVDKIVGRETVGPDVSRTGVQRDLLPLVEGTTVPTKYGLIKTDHILFIAAGAFSESKPSDLLPEFQGRFPIRVELQPLTEEEFARILVEPENALTKQYKALFKTEGVDLEFTDTAIARIAYYAALVNRETEDIGARRLYTVMFTLLKDYLYEMPRRDMKKLVITEAEVDKKLKGIVEKLEPARYIL